MSPAAAHPYREPVLLSGAILPVAHVGHYAIWVLYAIPVLIVVAAIIRSTVIERRRPKGTAEQEADGFDSPS